MSKSAPNDTEDNETYLSEYTSSRKSSKNSKELSSSTRADNISSIEKSEKYIDPQYNSLLQVMPEANNRKFCQQDLFTGEF